MTSLYGNTLIHGQLPVDAFYVSLYRVGFVFDCVTMGR
jgi:hypothetical protein